ncbi:MAG TPA: hypothetical protein GX396_09540 [Tissierellia bacterium]|nr:hypothetical protein [Tissierellia bacterium]
MYSNYRNNMPHYDSMPYNYGSRGMNSYPRRTHMTNTMPTPFMPEDMFDMRPFIPESEMPFTIDGDMPALPRTFNGQPGMPQMPGMPGMPQMPAMPDDGNLYPMPGMFYDMPQMNCEQLREMMRRMNCPMSDMEMNDRTTPRPPSSNMPSNQEQ